MAEGTAIGNVREAVARLRALGFAVCKPDPGEKKTTYKGWSSGSLEPEDFADGDLVGIIAGPLSDGGLHGHALVIPDLDADDALERADDYLPPTGMEEGRPGKPRSHRYYLVPCDTIPEWAHSAADQGAPAAREQKGHPGPFKKAFGDAETKKRVIDFLGTGGQAVCPPSVHGGSGEAREWVGGEPGEPAVVPFPDLWLAVCRLAEACGCSRPSGLAWPWEDPPDPGPSSPPHEANGNAASHGGLSARERAVRYLAKCDPAVSGQGGHDDTYWPARVACWGFDLGEQVGFEVLWEVFNPRCQPPWTESELRHKCADADTRPFNKPRGWLLDGERRERPGDRANGRGSAGAGDDGVRLGPLVLRPGVPRRTPAKLIVPVAVLRDGRRIDELQLTSAKASRRAVAGLLRVHLGQDADAAAIAAALGRLLAAAAERADRQTRVEGETLAEILRQVVPVLLDLKHFDRRGAWSEAQGRYLARQDVVTFTPERLLVRASAAADAPPTRPDLLKAVGRELAVLWSELPDMLARVPGDLPADSQLGAQLRAALFAVWHKAACNERVAGEGDMPAVVRAESLANRVRRRSDPEKLLRILKEHNGRPPWEEIHQPLQAWWRPAALDDGEVVVRLAMRWILGSQVGIILPGVTSQRSLSDIGRPCGLFDLVRAKRGEREQTVAVLTRPFTDDLLYAPSAEDDEETPSDSEHPESEG